MAKQRYHFRGKWANGDRLVVCSYGRNKDEAFANVLKAYKNKNIPVKKGDWFHLTKYTNEDHQRQLVKNGMSKNEASYMSVYGHTALIVDGDTVELN